jgi:hypothetical protein
MQGSILLNYGENTHQVEEEKKSRFLRDFLEQCFQDTPEMVQQIADLWADTDGVLPVDQKIKLRVLLNTYSIRVIDDMDGQLKIYLEDELVAQWLKAKYYLRKDLQVKDPKKRIFMEMKVECWSVFDKETEQES